MCQAGLPYTSFSLKCVWYWTCHCFMIMPAESNAAIFFLCSMGRRDWNSLPWSHIWQTSMLLLPKNGQNVYFKKQGILICLRASKPHHRLMWISGWKLALVLVWSCAILSATHSRALVLAFSSIPQSTKCTSWKCGPCCKLLILALCF